MAKITYRQDGKAWNLPEVVKFERITLDSYFKHYFYEVVGYRKPKKGEWFLSGAVLYAYKAPNDLNTCYLVAKPTHIAKKKSNWFKGPQFNLKERT